LIPKKEKKKRKTVVISSYMGKDYAETSYVSKNKDLITSLEMGLRPAGGAIM
jgi:hypothetical protein